MRTRQPRRLVFIVSTLSVATFVALVACEGPTGPAGPPGPAGSATTEPPGTTPPPGAIGDAGSTPNPTAGLTAGCMSPCHGFNGIVQQWQTSTHFIGVMANTEELPTWTGQGAPCGNCHTNDGLPLRIAGNVRIQGDAGPVNLVHGENNYRTPANKVTEVTYNGASNVATIGCTTCHDPTNVDPHINGGIYQKGQFTLRVPHGPDDQSYLEKSPSAGPVTGTPAGKYGVSNACIFCHKSRSDVSNVIVSDTNAITSPYFGPHEGPQSDIFTGLGGYQYAGQTYGNSTHQKTGGCAACHMPAVAANGNYPDHSMRVVVQTCQAAGCHANATSFDVLGGQTTVRSALAELRGLLNNLGALTRSPTAPYATLSDADLATTDYDTDRSKPGTTLTANQAGALFNYFLIARGSASGVHNPVYTKELLYDSIFALKGSAPTAIPGRP